MLPKPKKSLGQNFLIDKNIIDLIIEKGEIKKNDIIIEVGPGTGNLTEKIVLKKPNLKQSHPIKQLFIQNGKWVKK